MKSEIRDPEKSYFVKFIIATLCLVLIFAVSIAHSRYMDQKISDISKTYLSKLAYQNAQIIYRQISNNLDSLNIMARMLGTQEDFTIENLSKILLTEARNHDFISLGVVLKDGGQTFTPIFPERKSAVDMNFAEGGKEGSSLLLSVDWNYINEIMSGYAGQGGTPSRVVDGETVNFYAVPIYRNYTTEGVLAAFFDKDFFDNILFPDTAQRSRCAYIADKNGNIIYRARNYVHDSVLIELMEELSGGRSVDGSAGEKMRKDIQNGKGDTLELQQNDERVFISYVPINFQSWYFVMLTDEKSMAAQSKSIYDELMPALIYIVIITIAVATYLVYVRNQRYKRLERKIHIDSIHDESYRIIMEQTDEIIFEYDTLDKTYFHTANFRKNFGYEPTRTGFLGSLESDYVHPDDVVRFAEMFERMKQNRRLVEAEIRIINSEGEYLWTRVYMLGVFDKDGRLARVIGKIVNIDDRKKELQQLKEMAVTDSATGVYNKQTTEDMIKAFLGGEGKFGKHAMLIADIDNFKGINDDHGHRVGDAVISAMGIQLNRIFRASDIKGRIGGDEFMILMKDIDEIETIINKAEEICGMLGNYELEGKKQINFSVSVGIAIYDLDGSTYEELYEAADRALYNCKNCNKGTYEFCKETDRRASSR